MANEGSKDWNATIVRAWLDSRVIASRADQAVAERQGRGYQDDCDKATAEEMVCSLMARKTAVEDRDSFVQELRALLDKDDYAWRGVHDDTRFDRHVRSCIKKMIKMTKLNGAFENVAHYQ